MRNAKRLMASLVTAAMVFTSAPIASVPVYAAKAGVAVDENAVVATITDGKTVYKYGTLQDAIDNVTKDDEEIVLAKDIKNEKVDASEIEKTVKINLNGNKITHDDSEEDFITGSSTVEDSITIVGEGEIRATSSNQSVTSGNVVINGDVHVFGTLGVGTTVLRGTFDYDVADFLPTDGDNCYGVVKNTDNTYTADSVTVVWSWEDPAKDGDAPVANVNLKLTNYEKSITNGAISSTDKTDLVVSEKLEEPVTCENDGYDYYRATLTIPDDIWGNSIVGLEAKDTIETSEEKDDFTSYKIASSVTKALGHKYNKKVDPAFVEDGGKVVKVSGGDLKYTVTLGCDNDSTESFEITGALPTEVGKTASFTTGTGKDAVTYVTKTTAIKDDATCLEEGNLTYTFSIQDKEGNTLIENLKITNEVDKTEKAAHNFTPTRGLFVLEWVYEDDKGVEQYISAADAEDKDNQTILANYAEENGNVLTYRIYRKCKDCQEVLSSDYVSGTATYTKKNPAYSSSEGDAVPGTESYVASYTYTFDDGGRENITSTIAKEIPAYDSENENYGKVYAPGTFDLVNGDKTKSYEKLSNPTCEEYGVEKGWSSDLSAYVFQYIEKIDHTWVKDSHENPTTNHDGYDVYKCTNKDSNGNPAHSYTIKSYNGKTSPIRKDGEEYIVGANGRIDSIYKATGYVWKVAKTDEGKDDVILTKGENESLLTVKYVKYEKTSNKRVDVNNVVKGDSAYAGDYDEVRIYSSLREGEDQSYYYNMLTIADASKLTCKEYVTYTVNDPYLSEPYVYEDTEVKGEIHGDSTGTVSWAENGSASVKIVCNDCKEIVGREGITVTKGDVVAPTCTTDGYTNYSAEYTGKIEKIGTVTLENPTYKGSPVLARGHFIDKNTNALMDDTTVQAIKNEDGTYSAKVFCDTCGEYVDVVTKVTGPITYTDKTRHLLVEFTNGLDKTHANYADVVKNKDFYSKDVTLIDAAQVTLNKNEKAPDNTLVYKDLTNADVHDKIVDSLILENKKGVEDYSVEIKDADGKVIEKPEDKKDIEYLPVGKYTVTITGAYGYAESVEASFQIVENAVLDSSIYLYLDGKEYDRTGTSEVVVIHPGEATDADVEHKTYTAAVGEYGDVIYNRNSHTISLKSYSKYTDYEKIEDTSVTFKYYIDDTEVTPDEVVFTEAGKYNLKVVASKPNFQDTVIEIPVTISKADVNVAIDNSTMVEGNEPNVKYTISSDAVKDVTVEELGFKITSNGGDDLTKLRPGTYTLTATITNANYYINVNSGKDDAKLTVVANDGSTTEEQALADAAAKKINDLTDASSEQDVAAARAAYDALSAKAKSRVDAATLQKLTNAEDKIAADKVVKQLNKATTDADKAAAYEAYSKLSDAQKKLVDAKAPDAVAAAKTAKAAADAAKEAEAKKTATTAANTAKTAAAKVAKTNPKYTAVQSALKALNTALNNSASTSAQIKAATDKLNAAVKASKTAGAKKGATYTVGGQKYKATSTKAVTLTKAKNAKSVTVPATVKINGKKIAVTKIGAKAFAKSKATKITIKTKKLTKKGVKKSLKGSKVKTVKVSCGKAYVKKYKKFFTKANAGKKVTVK